MDEATDTVEVVAVEKIAIKESPERRGELTSEGKEYVDLMYLKESEEITLTKTKWRREPDEKRLIERSVK